VNAPQEYEQVPLRFYLIVLNGIAFAGANSESFIGLKKAALSVLPYEQKFYIDMNSDSKAEHAGYVPAPRYDSHYDDGKRNNLQGLLMPYNGNDTIRVYSDGFSELVHTIS
jgi:hypothetical protein